MDIKDLFAKKGELITNIEILQAQLQAVNNELAKALTPCEKCEKQPCECEK